MAASGDVAGMRTIWRNSPPTVPVPSTYVEDQKPQVLKHQVSLPHPLPPLHRTALSTPAVSQAAGVRFDPIFLFQCSTLWHKDSDPTSGWELVRALRSTDRTTRAMAASLLAKTENSRLPTRKLFHPRQNQKREMSVSFDSGIPLNGGSPTEVKEMKTPYGLEIIENCVACKLRKDNWLCGLSSDVLRSFSSVSRPSTYPDGALLFVEGQAPRGAFMLCSGRAKLSTTSRDGKVLILKVASPGEVLGLSAVISGTAYELTAETAGPCQVNFVEREALLRMMAKSGELGLRSAQAVSQEFQSVYRDIHDLVLARSSAGKLARLLLSWTRSREVDHSASEIRIRSSLTHEEMAQMIGASRETVTRLLSDLKKKEVVRLEGSVLVIRNRTALEALAV